MPLADIDPELEAAFDNRARVPRAGAILNGWSRRAEAFRHTADAELDLAYGPHARHQVDLFWPQADRNGPIALFLHGGYWQNFDRSWFSHFAGGLTAHGIPVAIPSFRLCPDVALRDVIDDAHACAGWLAARQRRSVMPVGHASGGHLALALLSGYRRPEKTGHAVRGAVTVSAISDLAPLRSTRLNDRIQLSAKDAVDLSPLGWAPPAACWLTSLVGGAESGEFARQSLTIVDSWGAHGVHTELVTVPGADHFSLVAGLADPASPVSETAALLCHSLE